MRIILSSTVLAFASAFTPNSSSKSNTQLASGIAWTPDSSEFAYGLPGSIAPIPEFDPLGLSKGKSLEKLKIWREAELQHGRTAMLAVLGLLVTEEPIEFHPLFEAGVKDIGPAIRHLDEVRAVSPLFFEIFGIFIGALELNRALNGWKAPGDNEFFQELKDDYFPGDINFDPLGKFLCVLSHI